MKPRPPKAQSVPRPGSATFHNEIASAMREGYRVALADAAGFGGGALLPEAAIALFDPERSTALKAAIRARRDASKGEKHEH